MHNKAVNQAREEVNATIARAVGLLDDAKKKLLEAGNDIQQELGYSGGVRIYENHVHMDIMDAIKRAIEHARMETVSFSDAPAFAGHDGKEHPDFDPKNPTPYIKDRTELWRDTWIIKPLEYALILLDTARPWYEHQGEMARQRLEEQSREKENGQT